MKMLISVLGLIYAPLTFASLPTQKFTGAITRDRTYSRVICNSEYVEIQFFTTADGSGHLHWVEEGFPGEAGACSLNFDGEYLPTGLHSWSLRFNERGGFLTNGAITQEGNKIRITAKYFQQPPLTDLNALLISNEENSSYLYLHATHNSSSVDNLGFKLGTLLPQ